jgi:carbonic anhydrase
MAELTRRELLKAGGATAAVVGIGSFRRSAPAQPPPGTWNHDPASPIGPFHWADIGFPACVTGAGASQSPVNIATGSLAAFHGPPLMLRYETSELGVENTGHVVEVPTPAGVNSTAVIGGQSYQLVQYHFHAPGEHAVNGRLADVEGHFVHMNAQGVTAVIGVFFRIGREPNPVLDTILRAAPATAGDEVNAGEASPAELFRHIGGVRTGPGGPVLVKSFYAYDGSLTTPGCTEGVVWSVLADGGGVSRAAVTRFHRVIARFPFYEGYPNNNRPVLPLNGRVIKLRRHGKDD